MLRKGETPFGIGERSRTVFTLLTLMEFVSLDSGFVLLFCRALGAPEGEGVREPPDPSLPGFLGERRRLLSSSLVRRLEGLSFNSVISSSPEPSPSPAGMRRTRGGRRVAVARELIWLLSAS